MNAMRTQNFFLGLVALCVVAGIASIYPKSPSSAQIDVKEAAAQSACQTLQGDTPSGRNIIRKERPMVGIAWYLAAVGQYDQALKLVDRMKYCGFHKLIEAGQTELASQAIKPALEIVEAN
jgi:hypothetical protein